VDFENRSRPRCGVEAIQAAAEQVAALEITSSSSKFGAAIFNVRMVPTAGTWTRKQSGQAVTLKDLIAENECDAIRANEVGTDNERVGYTPSLVLRSIGKA
jgi:hypothetical protein